jgi:citrate synthase
MVTTTEITQLNKECNSWREYLRSSRNELGLLRDQLQSLARNQKDKEVLSEVEHYHNQFYIQQINIHDLKQSIKAHERTLLLLPAGIGNTDDLAATHEQLLEEFHMLQQTITDLKTDFHHFLKRS